MKTKESAKPQGERGVAISVGDTVKDSITGFTGIVVVRAEHLNGCIRLAVQAAKLTKEGIPAEAQFFDEDQLILLKRAAPKSEVRDSPGGPRGTLDHGSIRRGA